MITNILIGTKHQDKGTYDTEKATSLKFMHKISQNGIIPWPLRSGNCEDFSIEHNSLSLTNMWLELGQKLENIGQNFENDQQNRKPYIHKKGN